VQRRAVQHQRVARTLALTSLLVVWGQALPALAADDKPLRISRDSHEFVLQTPTGPLVPLPGVTPVDEIDVLNN